jgi:hypothetical protein
MVVRTIVMINSSNRLIKYIFLLGKQHCWSEVVTETQDLGHSVVPFEVLCIDAQKAMCC